MRTVLAFCIVGCALAQLPAMNLRVVPTATGDAFGAKQLNGDMPYYYIRHNPASTSYVLFLEGGGWCNGDTAQATIDACLDRAGFGAGPPPSTMPDAGGILSANATLNPGFDSWNAVFIKYKDGASFGSFRTDPIPVQVKNTTQQMWMRGRGNFNAVVYDLMTNYGLSAATEVILTGGSAGGLATFYNLDHLASLLPATARLVGFPDAGFFVDGQNYLTGAYNYRLAFQGADPTWNVTGSGGTNKACLAANAAEPWRCLLAQYITPHLKTPLFVMNSRYDAYQLPNIAGIRCVPTPTTPCSANETAGIATYGDEFNAVLKAAIADLPNAGAFTASCWVHEENVGYCSTQGVPNCVGWTPESASSHKWGYSTAVPFNGGRVTPQAAFYAWYHGKAVQAFDTEAFNGNPTCVFEGHPVDA